MAKTSVIIPVYNEEATVVDVIRKFADYADDVDIQIYVVIDPKCTDRSSIEVRKAFLKDPYVGVVFGEAHGKGQCVFTALEICSGSEIILCDADVTLADDAVQALLTPLWQENVGQCIVIPKQPEKKEWESIEEDTGIKFGHGAWRWVSGIRRVRRECIPATLYGYLMESQINREVYSRGYMTLFHHSTGTISPLRFSQERINDLKAHGAYGKANGLI